MLVKGCNNLNNLEVGVEFEFEVEVKVDDSMDSMDSMDALVAMIAMNYPDVYDKYKRLGCLDLFVHTLHHAMDVSPSIMDVSRSIYKED